MTSLDVLAEKWRKTRKSCLSYLCLLRLFAAKTLPPLLRVSVTPW